MADTAPKIYDVSEYRPAPNVKHVHHGRTPAAWAGSMIALVGFIVGSVGLVMRSWPVFWAAAALIVLALIVAAILHKTGRGAV